MDKRITTRKIFFLIIWAFIFSNFVFVRFIQKNYPFISKTYLAIGLATFCLSFLFFYFPMRRGALVEKLKLFSNWELLVLVMSSFLFAEWIISSAFPSESMYNILLMPTHTIEIKATGDKAPNSSGNVIEITNIETELGHTSYNQFKNFGNWERTVSNGLEAFVSDGKLPAGLTWEGRTGEFIIMQLAKRPDAGYVTVTINGNVIGTFDLYSPIRESEVITHNFDNHPFERFTTKLSEIIAIATLFFILFIFLATIPVKAHAQPHSKFNWLAYSLPMIFVWSIGLLALWPGVLSADSIDHIIQAKTWNFNDWHSVLYTLIIWGLSQFFDTPSIVAFTQVLLLAITVAWGLTFLNHSESPPWVPWVISMLMAFSLANILTVITIWSDIPYSISLLALTICCIFIVQTNGCWLEKKINCILLGLLAVAIILFRQNGLTVALGTVFVICVAYRKYWKALGVTVVIMIVSWFIFTGPVYKLLDVQTNTHKINLIILHHLGAHVQAGTAVSAEEKSFLNNILLPNDWVKYNCATVNSLWYNKGFNQEFMGKNSAQASELLLKLFIRNPSVDVQHMFCSGSMIWRIRATTYLYESEYDTPGKWIANNNIGIRQNSRLPRVASIINYWFEHLAQDTTSFLYLITWRPAVYFLVALGCWLVLFLRRRDWRLLLIITPALIQTITIFLTNIAQDFRYQYSICLISFLFLGFLFVPLKSQAKKRI